MVILKFTLALFLAWVTALAVARQSPAPPVGGPYFYADPPGHPNPVQPRFRLNAYQALRSKRHIRAYFDPLSRLVLQVHRVGAEEEFRLEYLWTKEGRLRQRSWRRAGVLVRVEAY